MRAQMQLRLPVFPLMSGVENTYLCGRARITTGKRDAISDGPGSECDPHECERCPTIAESAASLVAPPSRALQPARPVRDLLYATDSSDFGGRGPLGPRGSHPGR